MARIYNALLCNRMEPKIENILRKNKYDFWKNRSTALQILTIRQILDAWAKKPWGNNIIGRLLPGTWLHTKREDGANTSCLRSPQRNRRSDYDAITKKESKCPLSRWRHSILWYWSRCTADVQHGDTLAKYQLIICLNYVLRTSLDLMKVNVFKLAKERSEKYSTQSITDGNYADDTALKANTPAQDQSIWHTEEREAGGKGLYVNANKTKYMCFNQRDDTSPH